MDLRKEFWKRPLIAAGLAALMWLLNPPQWTFHHYFAHFLRQQVNNRQLIAQRKVNKHIAAELSKSYVGLNITEENIQDLVKRVVPRIWNCIFFSIVKVDIKDITLTFLGLLGRWHFFVADSLYGFDEVVLEIPEEEEQKYDGPEHNPIIGKVQPGVNFA